MKRRGKRLCEKPITNSSPSGFNARNFFRLVASSGWRYRVPPRKAILLVLEIILFLSRRKFSLAHQVKSRHAVGDQGHEHQPSREPLKSPKRDRRKKSRQR